jgi:hypothetical protein
LAMMDLSRCPKDFKLSIFKDLQALTLDECMDNVLLLQYLVHKEVNANIRNSLCLYISLLNNRVSDLME